MVSKRLRHTSPCWADSRNPGAGSAGSSSAYYLRKFLPDCQPINATVFERSDYVGGRSTTVAAFDDPDQFVELGGSIFVKANKNLVSAAEAFGLRIVDAGSKRPKEASPAFGVWDGTTIRFMQAESGSWWYDVAKLLWTYGLDPLKTYRLMKTTIAAFLKMYEAPVFPFQSLSQAVEDVGLDGVTSITGDQLLARHNIHLPFSNEIIQASTRVNYASNLQQIHGLETMVCMATDGAMAIADGNWRIFNGMLKHSGANLLLNTSVSAISRKPDGSFSVKYQSANGLDSDARTDFFDSVVLAAPLQFSGITLSPAPDRVPKEIDYTHLHVTLFTSPWKLSPAYFNLSADSAAPEVILTTLPADESRKAPPFFSISTLQKGVNHQRQPPREEYVYKTFSLTSLSSDLLSKLLGYEHASEANGIVDGENITWSHEKVWASYPRMHPKSTFDGPRLGPGLFYTSGIESFIATMETSSLMGMNVARLMVDEWTDPPTGKGLSQEL